MSLTLDDFWLAYHEASHCAGRSVQICRSAGSAGSLVRLLDELAPEDLERAHRAIEAVCPLLIPALPEAARFGRVMAACWHLVAWQCLRDILRAVMKVVGVPPERGWLADHVSEEARSMMLLKAGHHAAEIDELLRSRYGSLDRDLRRTRYMLYKEMVAGWRSYCTECVLGIRAEPLPAWDAAALLTSHSSDYCSVVWQSQPFSFTPEQARVVRVLFEAWDGGKPEVAARTLLSNVGGEFAALHDVFDDHKAWGTMIVAGQAEGTYRLNAPP